MDVSITFSFFLIFSGAALFASLALATRQPLIIAYIALGAFIGPYGLSLVTDTKLLADIGHIGIIFLLFLLGLDMQPQALWATLRKSTVVALFSSAIFLAMGFGVAYAFGYATTDALVVGAAMMFSSTIIGIKLLPTTVLHHRHIGELMIGLLLIQDLLAIIVLMVLFSAAAGDGGESMGQTLAISLLGLPVLGGLALLCVRYVLLPLIARFDRFHEYIFLLALGWCLGMAEAAKALGLSEEIGAFIAGITIATSPISQYIAVNLKPLRDFFLILFFFSVGARFDLAMLQTVWIPALVLAVLVLGLKPLVYRFLLKGVSEKRVLAWDLGFRLGQASEFSLLIAYVAVGAALISEQASLLIQATTIITLLASSYIVVFNYPTPIAISDRLRRD
ncbi:sodium:proton antiporter [Halioglobus japonicus]|uniref:Sodium:proton antiporter n=1 Tax=Halioglobus japonicus TaxID=930805 RepID=A0AAP8MI17_9GAMM|nr:cation:proton antiporter [Halioglobus japonicus]AQA18914.1 sodium:proton antiporter [Halioglobus japonicus]PLW88074.1 sodium:proton antiporter [Halioglobus japonicus]GHD20697.1 sodium:hydrogen antiporter [Halioglobus japonicus]